jgi:hypothetical protein
MSDKQITDFALYHRKVNCLRLELPEAVADEVLPDLHTLIDMASANVALKVLLAGCDATVRDKDREIERLREALLAAADADPMGGDHDLWKGKVIAALAASEPEKP